MAEPAIQPTTPIEPPVTPAPAAPQRLPIIETPEGTYRRDPEWKPVYSRDKGPVNLGPVLPEYVMESFGLAFSTAMGSPERATEIANQFRTKGRSEEWETFRAMYQSTTDVKLANIVIERAWAAAKKAGFIQPTPEQVTTEANITGNTFYGLVENPQILSVLEGAVLHEIQSQEATVQDDKIQQVVGVEGTLIRGNQALERKVRILDSHLEERQKYAAETGITWKPGEIAAQMALWLAPTGADGRYVIELAETIGLDVSNADTLQFPSIVLGIQDYVKTATPEQLVELTQAHKRLWDKGHIFTQDWSQLNWQELTMDPNILLGEQPYSPVYQILDLMGLYLDAGSVLAGPMYGLAKVFGKGALKLGASPVLNAINDSNKGLSQKILAQVANDPNPQTGEKWSISKEQVATSQLPKPKFTSSSETLDDLPDGVFEEVARTRAIQVDIEETVNTMRREIYSPTERIDTIAREKAKVEAAWGGRIRLALSEIAEHVDGNGVRFNITIGRNSLHGFLNEHNALRLARRMQDKGLKDIQVWSSDGSKLTRIYEGDGDWERALGLMDEGAVPGARGNFYLRYTEDYFYTPSDKIAFGNNPVALNSGGFRILKEILDPRSLFDEEGVYKRYITNLLGEQSVATKLQQLAHPIYKLPRETRRKLGDAYSKIEAFGQAKDRTPTMSELYAMFPTMTKAEMGHLYTLRNYYDTIHWLQNSRLVREWSAKGFKTLSGPAGEFHGVPLPRLGLSLQEQIYNPITGTLVAPSPKMLDDLYKGNGMVLRTEANIEVGEGRLANLVMYDPKYKLALDIGPLSKNPLKYIPGYYPRIYKDNYYIYKINPEGTMNGLKQMTRPVINADGTVTQAEGQLQMVAVAPTKSEADYFVARRRDESKDGTLWGVMADRRLSQMDKTAADIDLMQIEGRLFFGKRDEVALKGTRGGFADIEDPINMLERTSRMVARQLGSEELTRALRKSFLMHYRGILSPTFEMQTWSEVEAGLKVSVANGSTVAQEALELWRYIRLMEAASDNIAKDFKRGSIRVAEMLDTYAANKLGGADKDAMRWFYNVGSEMTPDKLWKGAAHLVFIATTSARQFFINALQHLQLIALDPGYGLLRLQKDALGLMLGVKTRGQVLSGKEYTKTVDAINSSARVTLGLNPKEYEVLIRQYDLAGHKGIVDIHSFAGELPSTSLTTPGSRAGDVAQTAANVFRRPVRVLQSYGFDMGEHVNRAASYMLAVRKHMKNNRLKSVLEIDRDGWTNISLRADDYAYSMHRGNQFRYNRTLLSIPFQFMTFMHKHALLMIKGIPLPDFMVGKFAEKYGTKTFTRSEAVRLMIANLLLYGSTGLVLKDQVRELLTDKFPQYRDTIIAQIIESGLLDWGMDLAVQKLANDPELDLAFDETLSPGAGMAYTAARFYEAGVELSPIGLLESSPGGVAISRMLEAAKHGRMLFADSNKTPQEKAVGIADALLNGTIGIYNSAMAARVEYKLNGALTKSGATRSLEPKLAELYARGILGVRSQRELDQLEFIRDIRKTHEEVTEATEMFYRDVVKYYKRYGEIGPAEQAKMFSHLRSFLDLYEPEEQEIIRQKFMSLMVNSKDRLDSPAELAADLVTQGYTALDDMKLRIESANIIDDPEEKKQLLEYIDATIRAAAEADIYTQEETVPNLIKGLEEEALYQKRSEK